MSNNGKDTEARDAVLERAQANERTPIKPRYQPTVGEIFGVKSNGPVRCVNVSVDRIVIEASPRVRGTGTNEVKIQGLDEEHYNKLFSQVHDIFLKERGASSDDRIAICIPNKQMYAKFATWRFNNGYGELYTPARDRSRTAPVDYQAVNAFGLQGDVMRCKPDTIIDIATGMDPAHAKTIIANMVKKFNRTKESSNWHYVSILDLPNQEHRENTYLSAIRAHANAVQFNDEPNFVPVENDCDC